MDRSRPDHAHTPARAGSPGERPEPRVGRPRTTQCPSSGWRCAARLPYARSGTPRARWRSAWPAAPRSRLSGRGCAGASRRVAEYGLGMPPLARVQLAQTEPRSRPAWRAWLGLLLVLAPVVAYFHLVATVSVEVPYIDDYDAVVDYLTRTLDEPASLGPRRFFSRHNEHFMTTLRAAVLLSYAALHRIDFGVLNLTGSAFLVVLLVVLFAAFRVGTRPAEKLLAFAPAALFLVQPQYWMMLLSATTSLSGFAVAAYAALTFLALERRSPGALGAAVVCAGAATFALGSGALVLPLGALQLALATTLASAGGLVRPRRTAASRGVPARSPGAYGSLQPRPPRPHASLCAQLRRRDRWLLAPRALPRRRRAADRELRRALPAAAPPAQPRRLRALPLRAREHRRQRPAARAPRRRGSAPAAALPLLWLAAPGADLPGLAGDPGSAPAGAPLRERPPCPWPWRSRCCPSLSIAARRSTSPRSSSAASNTGGPPATAGCPTRSSARPASSCWRRWTPATCVRRRAGQSGSAATRCR